MKRDFEVIKLLAMFVALLAIVAILLSLNSCTPSVVSFFNTWDYNLQKADDATNYDTMKKVEDTCRSMVSSYNYDKLIYEQYKDSKNEEKQLWSEQAKMRANRTAVTYNEYILKNSYVWEDNIPKDIDIQLEIIQ